MRIRFAFLISHDTPLISLAQGDLINKFISGITLGEGKNGALLQWEYAVLEICNIHTRATSAFFFLLLAFTAF